MDIEQAAALNRAIRLIAIRHRAHAANLLAELGLYPGQEVIVLELAAHGPRTQAELAVGAGCEPPSITGMVRKLEAAGLVSRRPSPLDGRAIEVDLTDQGRALLGPLRAVSRRLAKRTLSGVTSPSVSELVDILTDLARSLQGR